MIRKLILALALVTLSGNAQASTGEAANSTPSATDLGTLPFITGPVMSPGGARVAALGHLQGTTVIILSELNASNRPLNTVRVPAHHEIAGYRWAGDNKLLITTSTKTLFEGENVHATRLIAYDVPTGTSRFIGLPEEGVEGDNLTYIDPAGSFVLLSTQPTIYDYPAVYHIDLSNNRATRIVSARDGVWDWYADNSGVVRAGVGRDGDRWWLLYRSGATSDFAKVIKRHVATVDDQIDRFLPIAGTDQGFAVAAGKSGRFGLYHYDFRADALGELIYEHPKNDIDDFESGPDGKVRSVAYTDDRSRVEWFDPELKSIQAAIDNVVPGSINRVVSMSQDRERMIVWTGSANKPGAYYVFDQADGRLHLLAHPYDKLAGKQLADMASVTYDARDGVTIPAYLTMPTGTRATSSLPLVIMPHGGPFARDEWGYDSWTQFLASKGYVVLQPNFRGSTGYGKQFVERGYGQWGRGMQDDIDDGVKWLVKRGIVDPKRVCIMGASFGGYAAEWAAVRNPDVYRCAISFAGVSDIGAQLKYNRRSFVAPRYFRNWRAKVLGTDGTTSEMISPAKRAADIKIPILIAHGDADDTVPLNQSQKLVEALTKAGRPPEFHVYKGEGHGFAKSEDQIDFFNQVAAFLATNNPA